jgi:cell division protein FtsW
MDKKVDLLFLFLFLFLLFFGFLILLSASFYAGKKYFNDPFYYLKHQFLFGGLGGLLLGIFLYIIPTKALKKLSFFLFLFSLFLVSLTFIPGIASPVNKAYRWINIFGFSFQPVELLKLTFILYLASWLESKTRKKTAYFIPFLFLLAIISLFLLAQPNFSALILLFGISLSLFFLAKTPLYQTFLILGLALISFLPLLKLAPYRMKRILTFLNPQLDPYGISYHVLQSKVAIGSGGIFGKGIGLSEEKLGLLPHPFSDSIFAVFAEEFGFLGSCFLLILFLIFFLRIYQIAQDQTDHFKKLVLFGIMIWFLLQTTIHIGALCGLLPLTGIPLPFISYGGSHLMFEIAASFLVLKFSREK